MQSRHYESCYIHDGESLEIFPFRGLDFGSVHEQSNRYGVINAAYMFNFAVKECAACAIVVSLSELRRRCDYFPQGQLGRTGPFHEGLSFLWYYNGLTLDDLH